MGQFKGFSQVQLTRPKRSVFDLSHQKRLSTRMGRLTPILMLECVPSDTFRGSSEILLRLAPLLAPIFDTIELYVHYFFVPNRLLWEEWETFITGGRLGVGVDPDTAPIPPYFDIEDIMTLQPAMLQKSSLADYLGVPVLDAIDPNPNSWTGLTLDAMPFIACTLVWYQYYRDRNFVSDAFMDEQIPAASGENEEFDDFMSLYKRSYRHDYFTSALPFTQRGEEVMLPVTVSGDLPLFVNPPSTDPTSATLDGTTQPGGISVGYGVTIDDTLPNGDIVARLQEASSATSINDFRSAYALQVWLERNAVGGSRYNESTEAHFGVKPQDERLQRPEYIGGGRIPVKISEVVSTAWSNDGSATVPLANLAGHGITYGNTNMFNYFCAEHGFIVGFASIMNPPSYMQGLPRMFRRKTFLDYPWPTFANLGEQEVSKFELYCDPASLTEDENGDVPLFGYQSRYADWKYICNSNHGDFRDDLLFWTLTRVFDGPAILNQTFVQFDDATQDRIFAVGGPNVDNFWMYVNNRVTVKRPLPYYGTPNTLGFGTNFN